MIRHDKPQEMHLMEYKEAGSQLLPLLAQEDFKKSTLGMNVPSSFIVTIIKEGLYAGT